jgi:serine/threonine protein kinase
MPDARGHSSPSTSRHRGVAGTFACEGDLFAGRYQVKRRISDPSMGMVHEAEDTATGEIVALKTVPSGRADNPELALRLQLEGLALAMIDHPGIVELRHRGVSDEGEPFVALELLYGELWSAEIERSGPQPLERAARIIADVCTTLDAVHRVGILHRDVKTEHIALLDDGRIKLIDFGLARLPGGEADWFSEHMTVGTPEYMAPEQWTSGDVDRRADIFSLGVVLYEALAGHPPFTGATPHEIARRARCDTPEDRLPELRPDLPKPIITLLSAMLAKSPRKRPRSCGEIRNELERFMSGPSAAGVGTRQRPT